MSDSAEATDDSTPKDGPQLKALKEVQAFKDAFAALTPGVPTEVDKGTIDYSDGETVAGALLVHHAIRRAAANLVESVVTKVPEGGRVVLLQSLQQAAPSYVSTFVQARIIDLTARARTVAAGLETPPAGKDGQGGDMVIKSFGVDPIVGGAVAAAAGGVVDLLIAATQSSITIRETAVEVRRAALIAPIIDRLSDNKRVVAVDTVLTLTKENPVVASLLGLLEQRNRLFAAAMWTRTHLVDGEFARLVAELTAQLTLLRAAHAEAEEGERARLEGDILAAESRRAGIQDRIDLGTYRADLADATVSAIDAFVASVSTGGDDSDAPLMTAALRASLEETDFLLYVEAANAGGGSLWKKTLGPDAALHQGGIAVPWILFKGSGEVAAGGVEVVLSSQATKPDQPVKLNEATATSITT